MDGVADCAVDRLALVLRHGVTHLPRDVTTDPLVNLLRLVLTDPPGDRPALFPRDLGAFLARNLVTLLFWNLNQNRKSGAN